MYCPHSPLFLNREHGVFTALFAHASMQKKILQDTHVPASVVGRILLSCTTSRFHEAFNGPRDS